MGRVAGKVADESSYVNADHLVVDGGARYPGLLAGK
jgi:hypothetical protein